jgi:hypothetical protein
LRPRRRRPFRPLDVIALALSLSTVGAFSVFAYAGGATNPNVIIEGSGEKWIYPLHENREVTVSGPLGDELIDIKDAQAWVVSSPCPNKICIQQGRISKPGQWMACLPNDIFIRVDGTSDTRVDMVSY